MTYSPSEYQARRIRNDKSRAWAKRERTPWTPEDDAVIQERWIDRRPEDRNEREVSQKLERTIEACRVRASYLRGNDASWGTREPKRHNIDHDAIADERRPVCPSCFMEMPVVGVCGTCE